LLILTDRKFIYQLDDLVIKFVVFVMSSLQPYIFKITSIGPNKLAPAILGLIDGSLKIGGHIEELLCRSSSVGATLYESLQRSISKVASQ
jgi:hypothetical protein